MKRVLRKILDNTKKSIFLMIIFISIAIVYLGNYGVIVRDFENSSHNMEIQINRYLELSRTFIDLMTTYGNEYFVQNKDIDSELYDLIEYDNKNDRFNLDAVYGSKYENAVGNLTGNGRVPEKGINRDEMNLALKYNDFFNDFFARLEGVVWLYYISDNDFINMYPWISSKKFKYSDSLKEKEYYRMIIPQNNPQRRAIWTPEHLDEAGKGSIVTLSSPIYSNGSFMGAIALDIKTDYLKKIIDADAHESYLVDIKNSILASSNNIEQEKEFVNIYSKFDIGPIGVKKHMLSKLHEIQKNNGHYVHVVEFDKVPWRLFCVIPVRTVAYRAALRTIPMFFIGVLLFITVYEFERSRRAGALLNKSLEELKAYQQIIENAAKCDILTNTYNRRGLKEVFNERIKLLTDNKIPISFVISDIDYFKQFNDLYGHAAGDKVLVKYADIIRKNIGQDDILCRWGGEEFVMILFGVKYDEAIGIAGLIRKEIEAYGIDWEDSAILRGTMTLGVAEYNYEDSIEECVSKADGALYFGKSNGRNQVNGYQDSGG
ncbi:MAG: diguanylate cyclase [Pseudomonadota bacterium]